ncbi:MAG: acyl carrier protein [Burkholderiaceae bacterium]|nr:acyl carrier protein [Burkholderiaceae bacterium]
MKQQEILAGVIETIQGIAPEVEADALVAGKRLRSQVDLDSMDWLNVIIGLHERFQVEIPESDYAQLTSLDAIVSYLAARQA